LLRCNIDNALWRITLAVANSVVKPFCCAATNNFSQSQHHPLAAGEDVLLNGWLLATLRAILSVTQRQKC